MNNRLGFILLFFILDLDKKCDDIITSHVTVTVTQSYDIDNIIQHSNNIIENIYTLDIIIHVRTNIFLFLLSIFLDFIFLFF